jgi:non-ribosomal peptide synthetase-like protein
VPVGERWHGSPAQRTDLNYARVTSARRRGTLRRLRFSAVTLFYVFFLYLPLLEGGAFLLLTAVPAFGKVLDPNMDAITSRKLYIDALDLSIACVFGLMLAGLIVVATVPRLLNLFIKPCTVYPLYGFRDRIHRAVARMTGVKFFTHLFGDSSFIVYYLRWIGYDLGEVEQTGSNPLSTGLSARVELRHRGGARDPIPEHDRRRDDGRRRVVPDERRLLEHILPGVPGVDRGAQLSREQHRLSGRRPDGRELPARDQGDDPA